MKPFKLASREFHKADSAVYVGKVKIGGGSLAMIAGPCAVESFEVMDTIAKYVKAGGANILRGGAFKPRTSPYAFQGMGEEGLKILQRRRREVRHAGRHRGDGPAAGGARRAGTPTCSRSAPEHAELRPPEGVRQDEEAGAARSAA